MLKSKKCLYLHGLESGPHGRKAVHLKKMFEETSCPDLKTGVLSLKPNSFMMSALRNISSAFSGSFYEDVTHDALHGATIIALDSISRSYPDIIVGSSMGGAVALEAIRLGNVAAPAVIVAPALRRLLGESEMEKWYDIFVSRKNKANFPILVIHGDKDNTVDIEHSRELCKYIGAELVEVAGGDHSLNDYLLTTTSHSGSIKSNLEQLIEKVLLESQQQLHKKKVAQEAKK